MIRFDADLWRQVAHWEGAIGRLESLNSTVSANAWQSLDAHLAASVRKALSEAVDQLGIHLRSVTQAESTEAGFQRLHQFRSRFQRTEGIVDLYADAINTRSSATMGAQLRTCDWITSMAMARVLAPLGRGQPPVLVYVDRGLGASILRANLKLWDSFTINPAALIKVALHNLRTCTALIHEGGHEVAVSIGWVPELAAALRTTGGDEIGRHWENWAGEIAADAFAFVNTGYASVVALADVLDSGYGTVFHLDPDDPHPPAWIRVLLGTEMCRVCFGAGPWDAFAARWRERYPVEKAPADSRFVLKKSLDTLEPMVRTILQATYPSLSKKSLCDLIDPLEVSPHNLWDLERRAGSALFTSNYWSREALRIIALNGLTSATEPGRATEVITRQAEWMIRMGASASKAA